MCSMIPMSERPSPGLPAYEEKPGSYDSYARGARRATLVIMNTTTLRTVVLPYLLATAKAQMSAHAQFAGRFDGMVVGLATKATKTKMGLAVDANEYVLFERGANPKYVTIWSVKTRCLTSVKASTIAAVV